MINKKYSYVIIAGCSQFGANIASTFCNKGTNVIIIDQDMSSYRKLSYGFSGYKIQGDATDIDVLMQAGIEHASLLIAATDDDNTNIMISQIATEIFHIPQVVSRLYDVDKELIYHDLNIKVIRPTMLSMNEFEKIMITD